jgi:hypothetical protein
MILANLGLGDKRYATKQQRPLPFADIEQLPPRNPTRT